MLRTRQRVLLFLVILLLCGCACRGGTCDDRVGGALITYEIVDETLSVWITNQQFIEESIALQRGGDSRRTIPSFKLVDGQSCDSQWSWHVQPEEASYAEETMELCDGLPSDIEADKDYWLGTVGHYCPWSAKIVAVDDRRVNDVHGDKR